MSVKHAALAEYTCTEPGVLPCGSRELARVVEQQHLVVLRNVLSDVEVAALKLALINALNENEEQRGPNDKYAGIVHMCMTRGRAFVDLLENSAMLEVMRAILGSGCVMHSYNSSSQPPNNGVNFAGRIHTDCPQPRLIPGYITNAAFTVALDPFTTDNGAMKILLDDIPLRPMSEEEFESRCVVLDVLQPGDAIFFNARCWHRGGVNHTQAWRHALNINFCRSYIRQQFDYPRMLDEQWVSKLSDDLKTLLGFKVRMPVSFDEYLAPPEQRPYLPGQDAGCWAPSVDDSEE